MGAEDFTARARGKTAQEAFDNAVASAQYAYGHAGYTGTIAEKDSFVPIEVPDGITPSAFVDLVMECNDAGDAPSAFRDAVGVALANIDDKWGPAGCVQVGPDEFAFFGWASS